ncbi:MAG: TfoX/Sxy family protein [Pseudoclavibacter sp.]|nr:TfoX/Sxy family protein [Pseudoclavibacter sp.]
MSAREELAARVRALLPGPPAVQEKSMFGSRVFLLEDRILLGAGRDGALLVRVDPGRAPTLWQRAGAARAVMGAGRRPMGPGWITVEAAALESDEELLFWIDEAREHHAVHAPGTGDPV